MIFFRQGCLRGDFQLTGLLGKRRPFHASQFMAGMVKTFGLHLAIFLFQSCIAARKALILRDTTFAKSFRWKEDCRQGATLPALSFNLARFHSEATGAALAPEQLV